MNGDKLSAMVAHSVIEWCTEIYEYHYTIFKSFSLESQATLNYSIDLKHFKCISLYVIIYHDFLNSSVRDMSCKVRSLAHTHPTFIISSAYKAPAT